nr:hypothetical protein [Janibacter limosus]
MWLTARAHGPGMGWVTLFDPDDPADLLGLPDGVVTLGWLCLGWPDERPPSPGLERAALVEEDAPRSGRHPRPVARRRVGPPAADLAPAGSRAGATRRCDRCGRRAALAAGLARCPRPGTQPGARGRRPRRHGRHPRAGRCRPPGDRSGRQCLPCLDDGGRAHRYRGRELPRRSVRCRCWTGGHRRRLRCGTSDPGRT